MIPGSARLPRRPEKYLAVEMEPPELDAEPAQAPLRQIRAAQNLIDAGTRAEALAKDLVAQGRSMEDEFWRELVEHWDERVRDVMQALREARDPEAAIIFSLRFQGWEMNNNADWLLEEFETLRFRVGVAQAARTATGRYP